MKPILATFCCAAFVAAEAFAEPIPIYENFGDVLGAPQIDAIAFANYGNFSVSSTIPYDFQSTQFFTNRGTMSAFPGFRFANASSTGVAFAPATNFLNEVGSTIMAGDIVGFRPGGFVQDPATGQIPIFLSGAATPSYLLISAENIVNKGYLVAGGAGLLELTGKNVDLSRSGLGIGRLELTSTHFVTDSNFFPDPGIYDNYWGLTNQFDMQPGNLLALSATATNATSPLHAVTNSPTFQFPIFTQVSVSITNPLYGMVSAYTNTGGADPETGRITNIYRQAAFVAVSDTNLAFDIKWAPSTIVTNPFQTAIVEINLADTNVVTGELELSQLYLRDMIASWTNYTVLTNLLTVPLPTMRPATFELTRNPPLGFLDASEGNAGIFETFFFDPADTNYAPVVTNLYAGYEAEIDSLASRPPNVPGLEITDFPGRVEITAENLDLTRARLRGSALVSVTTSNLVASRGVQVDSENVIYNLGVPNGTMTLQGIAKERVVRLNGPLRAWSAVWTNNFGVMMTNQVDDGQGNITNVVTNVVTEVDYHMLIVDATGLQATKPVTTHDFISRANEVVISDPMTVVRSFIIDAGSLTLNNRLTVSGALTGWSLTNTPSLKFFTNKGSLTVPNIANFGEDTSTGWETFSNLGQIGANGLLIRSTTFNNSGTLTSRVDGIRIQAETAQFEGTETPSETLSARDLEVSASDVRFTGTTLSAIGKLVLSATQSLSDTGEGANNLFIALGGFALPLKPELGDLLGTSLQSFGPRFARVEHVWAAEDRGPNASGFQNNVAIGELVLDGDREVVMSFRGATGNNGMYVDLLRLEGPLRQAFEDGDLGAALEVDPSLTIYFADSGELDPTQLEQLSNGRLRYVPDFAGPSTFVEVPVRSGSGVMQMERGVRTSTTVDSDGDGTPNAYDAYPLDYDGGLALAAVRSAAGVVLTWSAQPGTRYVVEYTSSLGNPSWQVLSNVSGSNAAGVVEVVDAIVGDHAQRYYRVRLEP